MGENSLRVIPENSDKLLQGGLKSWCQTSRYQLFKWNSAKHYFQEDPDVEKRDKVDPMKKGMLNSLHSVDV